MPCPDWVLDEAKLVIAQKTRSHVEFARSVAPVILMLATEIESLRIRRRRADPVYAGPELASKEDEPADLKYVATWLASIAELSDDPPKKLILDRISKRLLAASEER